MTRRFFFGTALVAALAAVSYACSDDEAPPATQDGTPEDGGVVVQDGGVVYVDGGIVYVDGGFAPFDSGPSTCADGGVGEPLGPGIFGCAGSVLYDDRDSLCGDGCRACNSQEWPILKAPQTVPTQNYWLNDYLSRSSAEGACSASVDETVACEGRRLPSPMRVCASAQPDPEGNYCNWTGCGLGTTTNQYFGGCAGNLTAGTLCCPDGAPATSGCATGTNTQTFSNGMVGCSGSIRWSESSSLCAASYHVCTAAEWNTNRGATAPTHNYWTSDDLRYSGLNSGDCSVSTSTGTICSSTLEAPMRVCGAGTTEDPNGNRCYASGCGLETPTRDPYFGGCNAEGTSTPPDAGDAGDSYVRAGTVCCCDGR